MSSKGKYIGIESRIQYEVLESALYDYLQNGTLNKDKCLLHIKQFTKGENRAVKILKPITVLLAKNKHIDFGPYKLTEIDTIECAIDDIQEEMYKVGIPIDGVVLRFIKPDQLIGVH